MVLKSGKNGVCSGNTLRLTNNKFIQKYFKEACISLCDSRPIDRTNKKEDEFKIAKFLNSSLVSYSLNKRQRWNLPDFIKGQISNNLSDIKCKVSLLEMHKLQRKNNCVGYFTNKGKTRQVLPRKNKYLNRLSVTKVNDRPSKQRSRRCPTRQRRLMERYDNENPVPAVDTEPLPELTYQVEYPGDFSSLGFSKPKCFGRFDSYRSKTAPKSKSKKWRDKLLDWDGDEQVNEDDFLATVCEADEIITTGKNMDNSWQPIQLAEYMNTVTKDRPKPASPKSVKKRTKRINQKLKRQTPIIKYVGATDQEESEDVQELFPSVYPKIKSTELLPVNILIPKHETNVDYLRHVFHDRVLYPKCKDRKFLIDITSDVTETLRKSKLFKATRIQSLQLTSFLVFSFKSSHDKFHDLYEVVLNIASTLSSICIETLFDGMFTDLEEVINTASIFIETLPLDSFYQNDYLTIKRNPTAMLQTIQAFTKQDSSTRPQQLVHQKLLSESCAETDFEWISLEDDNRFCNICFEDLSTTSPVSSTALRECGHWFCNLCWREYLLSSFMSNQTEYTCAEYDCGQPVDEATLLSLVNIRDIQRAHTKTVSAHVNGSTDENWCPNKSCGRILQGGDRCSVVLCQCGVQACIKCGKEGHWPASCEENGIYINKLNAYGGDFLRDDFFTVPTVTVQGKRCPKCKIFIEKNSGCPSMNCICGCNFCWSCVTPWKDHTENSSGCFSKKDTDGTDKVTIRHMDVKVFGKPENTKYFQKATELRRLRLKTNIKMVKYKAETLKARTKQWATKQKVEFENLQCTEASDNKLNALFKDIVSLNTELNFVTENSLVILDCHKLKSNPYLANIKYAVRKLQILSDSIINEITIKEYQNNFGKIISRLVSLRQTAKHCIVSVMVLITKYRKFEQRMSVFLNSEM